MVLDRGGQAGSLPKMDMDVPIIDILTISFLDNILVFVIKSGKEENLYGSEKTRCSHRRMRQEAER